MIRTTLFALLAGTVMAGATFAQDQNAPEMPAPDAQQSAPEAGENAPRDRKERGDRPNPILRLDADGDGQVTLDEARAGMKSPMAAADADGDGTLTREEMVSAAVGHATSRAEAAFDRLDQDSDGEVAVDELPDRGDRAGKRMEAMFERADADSDGVLSAEEIEEMRPMKGKEGRKGRHGGGQRENHMMPQDGGDDAQQ